MIYSGKGSGTGLGSLALVDHFSKEVQNIFQLTKNQIKCMVKNGGWNRAAGMRTLEYFKSSKVE